METENMPTPVEAPQKIEEKMEVDTTTSSTSPFLSYKKVIEDGDFVIVWVGRTDIRPIKIKSGETLQTKFGPFRHDHMIGRRYGTQIASMSGPGFVHLLQPTPELWAQSLPHRTQIVYSPDASYIIQRLGIRPGSRVVEAGTGSGALTHSLARTVGVNGRVFTYEYHADRREQANAEFTAHGLAPVPIISTHRNVCEAGFDIPGTEIKATAVFLDLPAPWTAIPFVKSSLDLQEGASICCFSPCIEQVIKTIFALQAAGFRSIETVENQARRFEAHRQMVRTLDESFDILRDMRRRRQEGLERRRKFAEMAESDEGVSSRDTSQEPDAESQEQKEAHQNNRYNPWGRGKRIREGEDEYSWRPISWVETQIKTHTAYLTFATLAPALDAKEEGEE